MGFVWGSFRRTAVSVLVRILTSNGRLSLAIGSVQNFLKMWGAYPAKGAGMVSHTFTTFSTCCTSVQTASSSSQGTVGWYSVEPTS